MFLGGLNKSQQREAASFQLNFIFANYFNNKEGCVELFRTLAERHSGTEDPEYKSFLRDELDVYLEFLQKMENFEEEALGSLVSELVGSFNQGKIDKETFQVIFNLVSQKFPNSRHLQEMQRLLQQ
jgi:hypothetical protein